MASSYYASNFNESALLSVDGFGDFTSTMWGEGNQEKIKVQDSISYPHSLGVMYTAITQFLGFQHFGDEYKVMGLAAYGKAKYMDQLRDIISIADDGMFKLQGNYFRHFSEGVELTWDNGTPRVGRLFTEKINSLFPDLPNSQNEVSQYHKDIAKSMQSITEEVIFKLAKKIKKSTQSNRLCLSGGVAQNSVANGKILKETGFKEVYIPPAGHDAGTCIGAALYYYHHLKGFKFNAPAHFSASLGPAFKNEFILKEVNRFGLVGVSLPFVEINEIVVNCLIKGGVVGWVQGRTEFGPRALGNRSILADPRRTDIREILNRKIKQRELFRPFAASVLEDHTEVYFDSDQRSPYMEKVFKVKEKFRKTIPSVTHVDGSCRIQSVSEKTNPVFHDLIDAFYKKTEIPMLINTSFNQQEPIVNTPNDALDCFARTEMDILVIGNILVRKEDIS